MAIDHFAEIKGIKGESKDATHKDWVDVLAWSWGMSQSGSFHTGGGGGAGKVSVQDVSFTKYVDIASPLLMLACCTGEHIDEVKLVCRKAGKTPLEYLIITMKKVMVTSVSTGGSGGEDRLTENVTLNFAESDVQYQKQKDDGSGGDTKTLNWNIEENKGDVS